jgi:hypothetical protein
MWRENHVTHNATSSCINHLFYMRKLKFHTAKISNLYAQLQMPTRANINIDINADLVYTNRSVGGGGAKERGDKNEKKKSFTSHGCNVQVQYDQNCKSFGCLAMYKCILMGLDRKMRSVSEK